MGLTSPARLRIRPVTAVAPIAFMGIGMTEASWGLAWEPMREALGQPVGALGLLLYGFSAGYLTVTLSHGWIVRHLGTARVLMAGAVCGILGGCAFAFGTLWGVLVAGSVLLGLAAAAVDAGLNSYISIFHSARAVSFMLAGFGVGATVGPLALSWLLRGGFSWRVVYGALAVYEGGLLVAWVLLRHAFRRLPHAEVPGDPDPIGLAGADDEDDADDFVTDADADADAGTDGADAARDAAATVDPRGRPRLRVVLGVAMFFVYVGTEQSIGTWAYWLLTGRGMGGDAARFWTTAYWASLAVGRLLVGFAGRRAGPPEVLLLGVGGGIVATTAIWAGGTTLAVAGLVLAGLSFAGVFPSMVALTPRRVGEGRAAHAMGFQLAAASLGAATVAAGVGLLNQALGPGAIGPALLAGAVTLAVVHLIAATVAGDLRSPPRFPGTRSAN